MMKILNRLSYDIKNQIKKDKDDQVQHKASLIMNETNTTKKWKLFKNFTDSGRTNNKIGDIMDLDNVRQSDDQAKANAFAERLRKSHSYPTSATFDRECEQDINTAYLDIAHLHVPSFALSEEDTS